jgi:site-specific recombinase XerD
MSLKFIRHSKEPGKAVWKIDWRPEGRNGPRRRRQFEGTREEAEHVAQSMKDAAGIKRHGTVKTVYITLEAALPEYLHWHQLHREPTTHADVRQSMPRIMRIFGRLTVDQVNPRHITDFVAMRPDKKRTNQKEIHYLRGMITWMVKQGYAAPLHFKPETPKYHRPLPQVPMPSEVNAVLQHIADPVKKALIILMWTTGGRITSTAQIRWEDVNWERGTITVRVKGGRALMLPLPEEFKALMFDRRQPSGWVFLNPKTGAPLKSIKGILASASKKAGLPYKMTHHKFRHAYATDTLEATGDLRLVQNALGHTNISTTTIYTLVQTRRLVDAQNKVAEMRKGRE